MEIGSFFGLTGVTIALAPFPKSTILEMIGAINTPLNKNRVKGLQIELKHFLDFFTTARCMPVSAEARRAMVKLRNPNLSEQERREYQLILEQSEKSFSPVQVINGKEIHLSQDALSVINVLSESVNTIRFIYDNLVADDSELAGEQNVFGCSLYLLRTQPRTSLIYRFLHAYPNSPAEDIPRFQRDINILKSHLETIDSQSQGKSTVTLQSVLHKIDSQLHSLDFNYLNETLDLEYSSAEDYYNLSRELEQVGLVGLTPYTSELYEMFKSSVSYDLSENLTITEDLPLFQFIKDLELILEDLLYFTNPEEQLAVDNVNDEEVMLDEL